MRTTRASAALLLLWVSVAPLLSKNAWEGPFQTWNRAQVAKVFNDSPWARTQTYSSELGAGSQGQNEVHYNFVVRLFSALPIRQAYFRMLQIMNNYDDLPSDRRQAFDSKVGGILQADVKDEVVLAVAFATNDPEADRNVKHYLDTATTATLSQSAFLYSPQAGRVDLLKYIPPGQEGIGARFIFPRTFKGKSLLQPGDKEMRFEFYVPPINQRLLAGFDGRKMVYQGELTY